MRYFTHGDMRVIPDTDAASDSAATNSVPELLCECQKNEVTSRLVTSKFNLIEAGSVVQYRLFAVTDEHRMRSPWIETDGTGVYRE